LVKECLSYICNINVLIQLNYLCGKNKQSYIADPEV